MLGHLIIIFINLCHKFKASKHINHVYSRNDSGPYCYQSITPMGFFSCHSCGRLGLFSWSLIPSVKQIRDDLGEPMTEGKLVLVHYRVP